MRVAIAGAGIAGLSVARALVRRGLRPIVIAPDSGYTASGAGIVTTQYWDRELAELAGRSQGIIRALVPVEACGMARIALSEEQARLLSAIPGARAGLPDAVAAVLSADFRRRVVHAVHAPDDFFVNPQELLEALSHGVDRVRARIWKIEEGRVTIDGGEIEADWLVLALGPWSSWLVSGLDLSRRRVQIAQAPLPLSSMFQIADTGLFARPDRGGALVGDGDASWRGEPDARAARPTSNFRIEVERQLGGLMGCAATCHPAAAGLVVRASDGKPVIRAAGRVLLVTGFGRDGLSLAPACGERIAETICEGRPL